MEELEEESPILQAVLDQARAVSEKTVPMLQICMLAQREFALGSR